MAIVLRNALLADIDPISVASGELRIEDGLIAERGETVAQRVGDEVVDCGDCVVMPGMVNGHTHLYSALAVGMPPPLQAPQTFLEILQFVWWRLDRALDSESSEMSARIGAADLSGPGPGELTTIRERGADSGSSMLGPVGRPAIVTTATRACRGRLLIRGLPPGRGSGGP